MARLLSPFMSVFCFSHIVGFTTFQFSWKLVRRRRTFSACACSGQWFARLQISWKLLRRRRSFSLFAPPSAHPSGPAHAAAAAAAAYL